MPQDVPMGKYRRITQPFENWILICDENLKTRRKVCNISQTFTDETGAQVFSWSLAANVDGKPFMILRVPPAIGPGSKISLRLGGMDRDVDVDVKACDASVCIGYQPVGPILRQEIVKETTARVSYSMGVGQDVSIDAPFKGLAAALSAIK
ncbi:invasion associated locus B family protein [Phyllobacterium zundukense]|uniref:Invasion associated locus B family protein n=1 Tax=Phyllobacterium zundukense TaxID=1867719 RepID=A0ACD4D8Z8_9HYPH|nr:invasion associated locus B family protein [Phyllobacterium zundukense]UXN62337.1 invasion associated locus B family protein [Phyllobacterium zundukense]